MNEAFRLSRIRAPRGTAVSTLLLAVVFVAFGLAISLGAEGHTAAAPHYFDNATSGTLGWLLSLGGQ